MNTSAPAALPWQLRLARLVVGRWPFPRGRRWIRRVMLRGLEPVLQQARASFDFRFGRLVDASLRPWPHGYLDLYLHGVFESGEVALWQAVLRPGDAVVDGGANIGYWSLVASRLVGARGLVLAYEPSPETQARLQANLLDLPLRRDEAALAGFLDGAPGKISMLYRRDREMVFRVRDLLRAALPANLALEEVANRLHLSPRTLHRRLEEEGASFRTIKEATRRDIAYARLTKTTQPIARIAACRSNMR